MKRFEFENVEEQIPGEWAIKSLQGAKNSMFEMLYKGYSHHYTVFIRPDDILNNVAACWSRYVAINAEKFRDQFEIEVI